MILVTIAPSSDNQCIQATNPRYLTPQQSSPKSIDPASCLFPPTCCAIPKDKRMAEKRLSIEVRENNVRLSGDFVGGAVRRVSAAIHNVAQETDEILLDLHKVTDLRAPQALALACISAAKRDLGKKIELILPEKQTERNRIFNGNWAFLISPEQFENKDNFDKLNLPSVRFTNGDEHYRVVNRIMDFVIYTVPGVTRSNLVAFEWALNEITDNVLNHSGSSSGGIVHITHFSGKQDLIEYIVCDAGVGIPTTLRSACPTAGCDEALLEAAIQEGVTRDKQSNQGNGLFGSFRISVVSGGHFEIFSGKARLFYSSSAKPARGGLSVKPDPILFPGTMIKGSLNFREPIALAKALRFKDKPYIPPIDYIASQYEQQDGPAVIRIKGDFPSFGSREIGILVRNRISNIIETTRERQVTVDLVDIHVLSSSFADEVFGKLFVQLGPVDFMSRVRLVNTEETVRHLIDRAIKMRMVSD
jgi:anti-sigma regulatory factor (Ser/Thr protein kinase)